jgi:hypothetical protein
MEGKGNHLKMILEYATYRIKRRNMSGTSTYYFSG